MNVCFPSYTARHILRVMAFFLSLWVAERRHILKCSPGHPKVLRNCSSVKPSKWQHHYSSPASHLFLPRFVFSLLSSTCDHFSTILIWPLQKNMCRINVFIAMSSVFFLNALPFPQMSRFLLLFYTGSCVWCNGSLAVACEAFEGRVHVNVRYGSLQT